mmetsp:Transcript_127277/g.407387  ORF Transcript_127277/g.407387 Transcript_127277/m.407387 type:complete len:234 (+) Transcript_127277:398-1099(+)
MQVSHQPPQHRVLARLIGDHLQLFLDRKDSGERTETKLSGRCDGLIHPSLLLKPSDLSTLRLRVLLRHLATRGHTIRTAWPLSALPGDIVSRIEGHVELSWLEKSRCFPQPFTDHHDRQVRGLLLVWPGSVHELRGPLVELRGKAEERRSGVVPLDGRRGLLVAEQIYEPLEVRRREEVGSGGGGGLQLALHVLPTSIAHVVRTVPHSYADIAQGLPSGAPSTNIQHLISRNP